MGRFFANFIAQSSFGSRGASVSVVTDLFKQLKAACIAV